MRLSGRVGDHVWGVFGTRSAAISCWTNLDRWSSALSVVAAQRAGLGARPTGLSGDHRWRPLWRPLNLFSLNALVISAWLGSAVGLFVVMGTLSSVVGTLVVPRGINSGFHALSTGPSTPGSSNWPGLCGRSSAMTASSHGSRRCRCWYGLRRGSACSLLVSHCCCCRA